MRYLAQISLRLADKSTPKVLIGVVMALVLSAGAIGWFTQAQAQTSTENKLCFAETGRCITGEFLAYFLQNGGVKVFGYPLGPQEQTHNRMTGRTYATQWFQYARFESHNEQPAPYKVLLGKLGEERLTRQGTALQTLPQESGPKPGCLWFSERKHNVCDQVPGAGFKTYWQTHGLKDTRMSAYTRSLMLFGYPLTEAQMETNAKGERVLTQWFQRARLEWYPDQTDPLKVQVTPLGTLLMPRER